MYRTSAVILSTFSLSYTLAAQSPVSEKVAEIRGTVTELASRRPTEKVWVCAYTPARVSTSAQPCVRTDSVGSYSIDHVPLGRVPMAVVCERLRGFGKTVASDTLVVTEAGSLMKHWSVPTTGCDTRRIRRLSGIYRGRYTGGFEESDFAPCAQDAWFLPSDSLNVYPFDAGRAWAEFAKGTSIKRVRKVPHNSWGSAIYYVRWRGTVTGPGHYGHMGVSAFQFQVDSILEMRAPRRSDCK